MATVPQYQRETKLNGTPQQYNNVQVNGAMFGENIAQAGQNVAKSIQNFGDAVIDIKNTIDTAHLMELANANEKWEEENLFDKEKGYYYKTGKDAAGKSKDVLASYDKAMQKEIQKYSFSPANMRKAQHIIDQKKTRVAYGVNAHDFKETNNYAQNELKIGMENAINVAINSRNNPEDIKKQLQNGYTIIDVNGKLTHADETTIALQKKAFTSQMHESVLSAMLSDNSLQASEYLEKHKNEIDSSKLPNYIQAVKDNELSYTARTTAQGLLMLPPEQAYDKINKIQNPAERDAIEREYNRQFSQQEKIKSQNEKIAVDNFYQTVLDKQQKGLALSYEDIPSGVDAETKLGMMNYINKNGQPDTDEDIWEHLYDMQTNNAQEFAKIDLNRYRGFLSESEYKQFTKTQETIKSGGYYSQIVDGNKIINQALKDIGLKSDGKQKSAYSEIRALVREYEARKGRKINDDELMNITNSLGYEGEKGIKTYKLLEKGMAEKTGFIRDVINDFNYYQKKHNGEFPPDEEKYKIINHRINSFNQDKNNELSRNLTAPKIGDMWNGHRITSLYGRRTSPTSGASSNHKGIDLAYLNNEKFTAFASGVVIAKGYDKGLGNFVKVKSSDGTVHIYGHANNILVNMNDRVTSGQVLGRAGSSGISTGPHLHYAKFKNGQYVNPLDNKGSIYISNRTSDNRLAF